MSKIITITYLLRNPKKVKEMVSQGDTILIKQGSKIIMEIKLPEAKNIPKKMPTAKLETGNKSINRKAIYEYDSWLNK